MAVTAKALPHAHAQEEHEDPREHLMLDPRPRGEMNAMAMEAMLSTNWKFWLVIVILAATVAYCLFYEWGVLIFEGQGVAGVTRPDYWGVFLVDVVFWIGISHAGTFISALLRVLKVKPAAPSPAPPS
jgi:molybdopterin-containing oxidoreductase family membrane subunit